mmetsp:Transcript_14978/g.36676  ORF Transcript_14978/g.36676 Transcript_14978/m.36676 type:complete len:455 (+) Transcript_14978:397-1761(+)
MSISYESCVAQLRGMFPNVSPDVIKLVLDGNGLNVEATVEVLVSMNAPASKLKVPKSKLPQLHRRLAELKLEMKDAAGAENEDFHAAAQKKDQIKAVETAIQSDMAHGHKAESVEVKIYLDDNSKAGFDFKYHGGGWDVSVIKEKPGQPDLKPGDRIISVGGEEIRGRKYTDQLALWKAAASSKTNFAGVVLRFFDASTTESKSEEGTVTTSEVKSGNVKKGEVKDAPKSEGVTPEADRQRILKQLNNGIVPDNFLRPPAYFKSGSSTHTRNQLEQDEQLARLLQDELFMEDLRNNPDAYLRRQPSRAQRTQTRPRPAATARRADISGSGSQEPKATFKERMSKLGASARERLRKMALFFKSKKTEKSRGREHSPDAELVPLAQDAENLPLAPDHREDGDNFVIESDDDLGVAPAVMDSNDDNSLQEVSLSKDDGDAVPVVIPDKSKNEQPEFL